MIASVVQLAVLNLYYIIQELPYIFISPINYRIDDYLILSANATHLGFALLCELVLVGVLSPLFCNLLLSPCLERIAIVSAYLATRNLERISFGTLYALGSADTREGYEITPPLSFSTSQQYLN